MPEYVDQEVAEILTHWGHGYMLTEWMEWMVWLVFLMALTYRGQGSTFRSCGLREKTGDASIAWTFDSPLSLVISQVLPVAAVCDSGLLGTSSLVLAGVLAVLAAGVTISRLATAGRLHPYLLSVAAVSLLVLLRQENVALAVGAVLLLVLQGYEERLWRLIGEVTVWGQGTRSMDWEVMGCLAGAMYCAALGCLAFFLPPHLPPDSLLVASFPVVLLLMSLGVLLLVLFPVLGISFPPFTFLGLNWVQGRLASWTFDRFGQEPQARQQIRWWL